MSRRRKSSTCVADHDDRWLETTSLRMRCNFDLVSLLPNILLVNMSRILAQVFLFQQGISFPSMASLLHNYTASSSATPNLQPERVLETLLTRAALLVVAM
jgi:hypothetical protein